jgi:hypothetical protein
MTSRINFGLFGLCLFSVATSVATVLGQFDDADRVAMVSASSESWQSKLDTAFDFTFRYTTYSCPEDPGEGDYGVPVTNESGSGRMAFYQGQYVRISAAWPPGRHGTFDYVANEESACIYAHGFKLDGQDVVPTAKVFLRSGPVQDGDFAMENMTHPIGQLVPLAYCAGFSGDVMFGGWMIVKEVEDAYRATFSDPSVKSPIFTELSVRWDVGQGGEGQLHFSGGKPDGSAFERVHRYREVDGVWMRVGDRYVYRKNGSVRIRRHTEVVDFASIGGSMPVPRTIRVAQWNEGNTFRIEIDCNAPALTRPEDFVIELPEKVKFRSGDIVHSCMRIDLKDPGFRGYLKQVSGK